MLNTCEGNKPVIGLTSLTLKGGNEEASWVLPSRLQDSEKLQKVRNEMRIQMHTGNCNLWHTQG